MNEAGDITADGGELQRIYRKDAAKRLITTAIELVFANGDAVSTNVLTWSATEMLRGIASASSVQTFHAELELRIKPDYIKDWRHALKGHYNYFKHADRDPERVIEDFSPDATTWALFAAQIDYNAIYKTRTWPMLVYHLWFMCRYPSITYDKARELVDTLAASLDFPADKPLGQSVGAARQMLLSGRKYPEVMQALGPDWLKGIEPELGIE